MAAYYNEIDPYAAPRADADQRVADKVFFGDCRDTMRKLLTDGVRVQMCVTSPPYFGLRDYGHPGQIGLEKTPAEYVAAMVEAFALVREMLADDGVLWLNLGDSYNAPPGQRKTTDAACAKQQTVRGATAAPSRSVADLKPKDLLGIPWRVAFALQAAGWYLRQDIIWSKPNPMPESVRDRCTKAHEYLFLLTKSERYYFDHVAIQEPADPVNHRDSPGVRRTAPGSADHSGFKNGRHYETRNKRSVWTVPTQPYSGAHFATFPPKLIEPCILAGSRTGDVVLDPFMGSGTTAQVAQALGRRWIGCELNSEYAPLQQARTAQSTFAFR